MNFPPKKLWQWKFLSKKVLTAKIHEDNPDLTGESHAVGNNSNSFFLKEETSITVCGTVVWVSPTHSKVLCVGAQEDREMFSLCTGVDHHVSIAPPQMPASGLRQKTVTQLQEENRRPGGKIFWFQLYSSILFSHIFLCLSPWTVCVHGA